MKLKPCANCGNMCEGTPVHLESIGQVELWCEICFQNCWQPT